MFIFIKEKIPKKICIKVHEITLAEAIKLKRHPDENKMHPNCF